MKKYLIIIILALLNLNISAQQWVEFEIEDTISNPYGGNGNTVSAFLNADSLLYVGGSFYTGGELSLNDAGTWDGSQWDSLSSGVHYRIESYTYYKGTVYAGGGFLHASDIPNTMKIARRNGVLWEGLPNSYGGFSLTANIKDMIVYNDTLIIGTDAPTQAPWSGATRITAYDADINDYVDIGKVPDKVYALEVYNEELYAGGQWFTLKKYVGGTGYEAWEDVGGYCNYYIQDMAIDTFNNFLYVAGGFTAVDDTLLTNNAALWNGYYWERVGHDIAYQSSAWAIEVYNGDVYVGLSYDTIGGVYTESLARWDGQDWNIVGGGVDMTVYALEVWQDKLYVGGNFDSINGQHQRSIACWHDPTPNCRHLKPRIFTDQMQDTFDLAGTNVDVQFYNNNAYVDSWSWDFGDTGTDNIKDPTHTYSEIGTYNVGLTITHGSCTETFNKDIVIINSQSVEELKKETGFRIYPNPSKDNLQLTINNAQLLNKSIEILDVNGKTIKQFVIAKKVKQSIDISTLPKGIYFVKIGEQTERFVKE